MLRLLRTLTGREKRSKQERNEKANSNPQVKIKYAFDKLGAAALLTLLGPGMSLVALAIKLEDGGDVFFRQERAGEGGQPFHIWKFRTMIADAEKIGGGYIPPGTKLVTNVGKILRKTSLDELPQLINILVGEMSFVGPRPTLTSQAERYTPEQKRRFEMRPGVAGWAQLHGRNSLPWSKRIEYDVEYVETFSLLFDVEILLRTVPMVLLGSNVLEGQTAVDVDDLGKNP